MTTIHVAVIDNDTDGIGCLEFNLNDPADEETFNILFGFTESSLDDIPSNYGIKEFTDNDGYTVLVGENFHNLLSAVEQRVALTH